VTGDFVTARPLQHMYCGNVTMSMYIYTDDTDDILSLRYVYLRNRARQLYKNISVISVSGEIR